MSWIINQKVKNIFLVNIHYLLFFSKDIHERYLSLEDVDEDEQSKLVN